MDFTIKSAITFLTIVHISDCQIDELRRQRNPYEFFQIGAESPPKPVLYLESDINSVPPVGTSDFVRHFARETSGENIKNLRLVGKSDANVGQSVVRRLPLMDTEEAKDPHSSHRNFVIAGDNQYYAVHTSREPEAPITGHYHSSYADRNKGGKLYLGNRPFYF
ncbi:unnamed protein product [Medioppia subpectinata]|uniref:Uncharacterized protein n=1 Tax=Medioppia subpectinata TaxID=1979941 RepID=A0A7R9Q3J6_9ACAR|nr:unnamed protein product [Medioppia subpectinata]CAG2111342.1 unnamed protein product [Medioppia subpectinata]